jgi:hypothetical protein
MTPTAPDAVACPACHARLAPGARYCHRCGRALSATSNRERNIWFGAWTVVAVSLASIVYSVNRKDSGPVAPDMANAGTVTSGAGRPGTGAPPDISQMSPKERFLRLHDRIMAAGESGDSATAQRFTPMAIAAYGMLDPGDKDVDLRYHAGTLYIRAGQFPAALALADTIQALAPGHLMADMLRLEVAQTRKDAAGTARFTRAFLDHFDRQIGSGRAEYAEHRGMLDDLRHQLQNSQTR